MGKWFRITIIVGIGLLLLILAGLLAFYLALRKEPEFYGQALQADPIRQHEASDQMLQKTTTLANDVKQEGDWEAVFTAQEINGWLAVDLVKNHPQALPEEFTDPRVHITPDRFQVACRVNRDKLTTVITLTLDVYLAEPDVIAVRICAARAGLLPVPLDKILKGISQGARRLDLRLQWRQADSDPVALITIPPPQDVDNNRVHLTALQLGDGEIYVAGTTEKSKQDGD